MEDTGRPPALAADGRLTAPTAPAAPGGTDSTGTHRQPCATWRAIQQARWGHFYCDLRDK
jgi:hypothetical protein